MHSRDLIGQAKGMLMQRFDIGSQQAFELLSRLSQEDNIKLRAVAERLLNTGTITRPAPRTSTDIDRVAGFGHVRTTRTRRVVPCRAVPCRAATMVCADLRQGGRLRGYVLARMWTSAIPSPWCASYENERNPNW